MSRVRRCRVQIQRHVDIPFFQWSGWRPVCESWAEIHNDLITVRYKPDLFPGMRVKVGNEYFEIVGVVDRVEGKKRLVELHIKTLARKSLPRALVG